MNKYNKIKYKKIRAAIKELADLQPSLKKERKTVNYDETTNRLLSPTQAIYQHFSNREQLRHLYHAYYLMRGDKSPKYKYCDINNRIIVNMMTIYEPYVPEKLEEVTA